MGANKENRGMLQRVLDAIWTMNYNIVMLTNDIKGLREQIEQESRINRFLEKNEKQNP